MCVRKLEENENKKKVNKQSLVEICGLVERRKKKRFSKLRIKVPISFFHKMSEN
jgi:hypothetical protein